MSPVNTGAGLEGQAIQQFGDAGSTFGAVLLRRMDELERQKENAMLVETGSKIDDEILNYRLQYEKENKGIAASGSLAKADEFIKGVTEKYKTEGASDRYNLQLSSHINTMGRNLKGHMAVYEAGQLKDYSRDVRTLDYESSRKMSQSGDFGLASANFQKTLDAQKEDGSLSPKDYEIETIKGKSGIAEAYISGFLNRGDAVSAKVALETLKPLLTTDTQARLEAHVKPAAIRETGMKIGDQIFKENPKATLESMYEKIRNAGLDADTANAVENRIKELRVIQNQDETIRDREAVDNLSKALLDKTKSTRGYILPGHLSGPEWNAMKDANPKRALEIQNQAQHNLDTLANKGRMDQIHAIQMRNIQQDENAIKIFKSEGFMDVNLRDKFNGGEIGFTQLTKLDEWQKKMDPMKRESVKNALKKVDTGEALATALDLTGADNKAKVAGWKLKYDNLIMAFAYNNMNDPNFDTKMSEYVEKNVLEPMVTSWFSLDETDRAKKFKEAEAIAGPMPTRSAGKRTPTAGQPAAPSGISKDAAIAELKRRGKL